MRMLSATRGEVVALGFAPEQPRLVASHQMGGTFVWDLAAADPLGGVRKVPDVYPRSLWFAPDGDKLFIVHTGHRAAIDLTTGGITPVGPVATSLIGFAQSRDGNRLVLAHGSWYNPRLSGWHRAGDWVEDWARDPTAGSLNEFAISETGEWLASFARKPTTGWPWSYHLSMSDAATGKEVAIAQYPYSYRSKLLFRPDGEQLVAVHEMTLLVWRVPRGGVAQYVRNDSRRHFTAAAFHPSNRYLFTTSNDATVIVWDTETWRHVTRFTWNIGRLRSVAISPDGTVAAAGSDKGQIVVWDVDL